MQPMNFSVAESIHNYRSRDIDLRAASPCSSGYDDWVDWFAGALNISLNSGSTSALSMAYVAR